jgi:hypothetical protein
MLTYRRWTVQERYANSTLSALKTDLAVESGRPIEGKKRQAYVTPAASIKDHFTTQCQYSGTRVNGERGAKLAADAGRGRRTKIEPNRITNATSVTTSESEEFILLQCVRVAIFYFSGSRGMYKPQRRYQR